MASATSRRARYCSREKSAWPSRSDSGMTRYPEGRLTPEQETRPARPPGSPERAALSSFYPAPQEASLPLPPLAPRVFARGARREAAQVKSPYPADEQRGGAV